MATFEFDSFIKWNSYDNIHKCFDNKYCDSKFDINADFTVKLDGSNLSIKIKKINSEWKLISINGRNSIIWPNEDKQLNKIGKYGNAGNLGELPIEMFKIAIKVAEKINVEEIIVYGEAFRAKKDNRTAKFASWHPFGFYILGNENPILVPAIFFQDICPNPILVNTDFYTFIDLLINTDHHCIFPSIMSFSGKIGDGIIKFKELMMNPPIEFEGFFIVINEKTGYKWKTPKYEEQPKIRRSDQCNFMDNSSIEKYKILEDVYFAERDVKPVSIKQIDSDPLITAINTAFQKEHSKMLDLSTIPKKERLIIADSVISLVITEILSHYTEESPCPWTENVIKEKTNKLVKYLIMKL
jgi:hypothetical protein